MIALKANQEKTVTTLASNVLNLLDKDGQRICILKAPTGSGKTIMMAETLNRLAYEIKGRRVCYVWLSTNDLHTQSKEKLERYLNETRYTFSLLDEINSDQFKENEVVFANWESLNNRDKTTGEWTNLFMRENEKDKNLGFYCKNTRDEGIEIILIVDESHRNYFSERSRDIVNIIEAKLIIEVSATPEQKILAEDVASGEAGMVTMKLEQAVDDQLIKKAVVINPEIGKYRDFCDQSDEAVLYGAVMQLKKLQEEYKKENIEINPILLVQLPSEAKKADDLDKTKMKFVEDYLKEKFDMTVQNGKIAVWLSERKENLQDEDMVKIENNHSQVEVLIFKQAIATGWDCPRAQILLMFREIKSDSFKVQTVGRILRTPEAKHYNNLLLDQAYVFTNLPSIVIDPDKAAQQLYRSNKSNRIESYQPIALRSAYISRASYNDMMAVPFRKIFFKELDESFGIVPEDLVDTRLEKADKVLELDQSELTQEVLADVILEQVDVEEKKRFEGNKAHFKVGPDTIKMYYEQFAKSVAAPFSPSRTYGRIQQAIYDWFKNSLGYTSLLEIQRVIVCSANNQRHFRDVLNRTKEKYRVIDIDIVAQRQIDAKKELVWEVPEVDYFNENYQRKSYTKYVMEPAWFPADKGSKSYNTETTFEERLDKSDRVKWWYKNGESKEIYLGIPYKDNEDKLWHTFYPDYVIQFEDGRIGIYDTKSGFTAKPDEVKNKYDALMQYIKDEKLKGKNIDGGIVIVDKESYKVFKDEVYPTDHIPTAEECKYLLEL